MCVTDKFGNVIAATPSGLSSTAGVAGRTGIIHGSRLTSLNTFAGTPDVIQPDSRPLAGLNDIGGSRESVQNWWSRLP